MARNEREYAPAAELLKGRVILVTGAGDGIGKAVARALGAHGATVILLGRTVAKLEAVYDELLAAGAPQPGIYPMDLMGATWGDFEELVQVIEKEYGRLDGLLHNAAILGDLTPIEHLEVTEWEQTLRVNLSAPFMLTRACLPVLYASEDASVVFTSSGVARTPRAYWGAYAVSKAGCEALMKVLADETEFRGTLRFNSINPGPVQTSMRRRAFPVEDRSGQLKPEDIVGTYLFLLGPASKGITGEEFDAQ